MTRQEKYSLLFVFLGIVLVIFLLFFYKSSNSNISHDKSCITNNSEKTVRGASLTGIVESGECIVILENYYNCNSVKRDEVIAYEYAGNKDPIIKIIKAIPGDTFHTGKTDNGWSILINEEILKNSKNEPYILNEKKRKMISLYENDYNGVMPEDVYLLLGNITTGSLDSTKFGLVGKKNIIGKVIECE